MIPKFDLRAIVRVITRNWFVKLASIAFAIGLWGFVNLGAREAEKALFVPLELKHLPARLTITTPIPEAVNVRVRGPRTLLGTIDERRQRLVIDLTSIGAGTTSFKIDPEMLNLPRGVRVIQISPVQVTLDVEAVIDKTLPVVTNFAAIPSGFRVLDSEVRPPSVTVTGPAGVVNALKGVPTGPLHLNATTGNFEEFVTLERPADLVRVAPERVTVRGRLEESTITQDFKNVEIGVRKAPDRYHLRPESVDVTVRGPQRLVKGLELGSQNVYVDLEGVGAGNHVKKITTAVPVGVEVVQVRPEEATVQVLAAPATRRHPPR